jgi:integrase
MRAAIEWENQERKKLKKQLKMTRTVSLTIKKWVTAYMDFIVAHGYAKKTYEEKHAAFKRFGGFPQVTPDMGVENVDRYLCAAFFNSQMPERSGNAVNKDRKNLGAAWKWGGDNFRSWPRGENPFLAVPKKAEQRHPRYVPPEAEFWKVYDYVAGLAESEKSDRHIQDRVMLFAYLHLAARRSELFKAKWSDVDFAAGRIRLWTRKRQDGGLECDWLPLTGELQEELKMWAQRRLAHSTTDKSHLFVSLNEIAAADVSYGLPFTSRQHTVKTWCKKVDVKPFGWHAIRHLSASILYRRGYSQSFIQAILRHKSPTTTARYLRTLGVDEVREVLSEGLKRDAQIIPFEQKKKASSGPV